MSDSDIRPGQIDPITFEVLRNAFMSVVDEMGLMLERVGHSLVVSEGRDFSAAICDADGRMIAEGKDDLPAHVGTLPFTVKGVIEWVGREAIHEGDIFIMNDAFIGGTHCQDVRTIMPVFRNGELIAFVQNSAHWSDAGWTTRSCASSSATCACRTRRRATCSRRSPRAAPARRACRA